MGDIADMHIEALEAGLDPNEMDGADWADFYGLLDEKPRESPTPEELAADLRVFFIEGMLEAGSDGEKFTEQLRRHWPAITEQQAKVFEQVLEIIGAFPEDD